MNRTKRPSAIPPVVVAIVVAVGLLGGCGSGDNSIQIEGEWRPIRGAATGDPPERRYLKFEENGDFVGNDGCNGMSGSLSLSGSKVDLEKYSTSDLGCSGQVDFAGLFRSAETVKRDGTRLIFLDSDGEPVLELEPSSE